MKNNWQHLCLWGACFVLLGGGFCLPPLASYPLPLQHDVKHMIRTVAYVNIWSCLPGLYKEFFFLFEKMPPIMCPATSLLPCNQIKLLRLWLVGPERNGWTQVNQKNWRKQPSRGALSWRGDANLCHDCWGRKTSSFTTFGALHCWHDILLNCEPSHMQQQSLGFSNVWSDQVYTKAGQGNILCRGTQVTHQGFSKLLWFLNQSSDFLSPSVKTSQEILMTATYTKKL